jgi:16S rRNA (cytidine1402-2'-O)-methyltransferase
MNLTRNVTGKIILKLILLTTPIGNIADSSVRLREYLSQTGVYFVEDTRKFYQLLELLGLEKEGKKVIVFNDHKQSNLGYFLEMIKENGVAYLLSDAGSPIISDPAYPLVKAVIDAGGDVESIPGASAVTMALELSALPPTPFTFHGFLPRKSSELKRLFSSIPSKVTHLFFESPKRITTTLEIVGECLPNSSIVVVRELTKKFEEHYRFLGKDATDMAQKITTKGEFVLLVHHEEELFYGDSELQALAQSYLERQSPKSLAKVLASILDKSTSDVYELMNKK